MTSGSPPRVHATARAKVNLSLEVVGRRPDGYHDVVTIFQSIDLADRLTAELADQISLAVAGHQVPGGPADNLVLRAADLLRKRAGVRQGAHLSLTKSIPVAAGLGGGSADAAAALVALDRLWGCGLQPADLAELGAELGADVPFCLIGGAALGEARGDRLTPLPPLRATWLVLVAAGTDWPDKTRQLYAALEARDWSDGGRTFALADALITGVPIRQLGPNAFEAVARRALPEVEAAFGAFERLTAPGLAGLSGSGPSVFMPLGSAAEAEVLAAQLRALGYNALVTRPTETGVELDAVKGER